MKYLLSILAVIFSVSVYSQSTSCEPNMDFEYGNFSYWSYFQGTCCIPFTVTTVVTPPSTATTGRETITSGTGTDPYGGFPVVAVGGSYSLKLGTDDNNRKADRARYFVHVPSGITNYALIYRYAIVMEDPGHIASKQPRFAVNTTDSATDSSVACGNFLYVAGSLPGFNLSSVGTNVYYKAWSTATINLSGLNGHTIIVDFTRGDCDLGAHFGYGYVDMTCGLFAITINPCHYSTTTSLSGPPGFQTYKWMDSSFSTVVDTGQNITITTPSTTTTYRLILTPYSGYGCTDTLTTRIIISNLALHPRDTAICAGKTLTLNSGVSGGITPLSYSWTPSSGLSCTTCSGPTITPTSSVRYYITVADSTGCSRTDSIHIHLNSLPPISGGPDKTICFGNSTSITASGGSSYIWSPPTGLSCDSCTSPTASPSSTSTYVVTGTDTNGCVNTDTVVIKVNSLPNVNAGADKVICYGNSTTLTATGAPGYVWSPATGLSCTSCASPTASPTSTTTYVVTGTDTNSCSKTDTVIVQVNPLPLVNAGADKVICYGNNTTLTATGAFTYTWSPSTGLSCSACASPTASPISTTTYIVTGTDTNSCNNIDTVIVHVNLLPDVEAGADKAICYGNSSTLTATGASTYIWSPSTGLSCTTCASPIASPTSTSNYIVTGTDTNGCSKTDTVIVTVNLLPNVNAGADKVICYGNSTTLTATGASGYVWSPATGLSCTSCASPTASSTSTTTYVVTGTDTNSCSKTDTAIVQVNPLPLVTGPDKVICIGNSISLSVTGASGYIWSPSTGLSCSVCSSPTASPASTTTYIVAGTDTNGCVNSDTIVLMVNPLPNVYAGPDESICNKSTTILNATGAATYSWSPSTGLSCTTCASPTASPTSTTSYIVTGTDTNDCINTDTVVINIMPRPLVIAGPDTAICQGLSFMISASGAVSYIWSPATSLSCSNCDSTIASPLTTTQYAVIGTDSNGCRDTANVIITIHTLPVISINGNPMLCDSSSEQLYVTGAKDYQWSPATNLSCSNCSNPIANPLNDIVYVVVGTDVNGCTDSNKIAITVVKKLPVSIGKDDSICLGQSVQLFASGGTSYLWSPGESLNNDQIPDPIATPAITTRYKVVIKQNVCFTDSGYISVLVLPTPSILLGGDKTILAGSSIQLNAIVSNAIWYEWSPTEGLSCINCLDPIASPKKTTTYTIFAKGSGNCDTSANVTIRVKCENTQVFIPNTFTPNGDGKNDIFYASGKGISEVKSFSVFDRWGEMIFEAHNIQLNDPMYGWDGKYNGKLVKPDVYVYILTATCESGEVLQFKGDVSIVK